MSSLFMYKLIINVAQEDNVKNLMFLDKEQGSIYGRTSENIC
jgi:hypothetical protein